MDRTIKKKLEKISDELISFQRESELYRQKELKRHISQADSIRANLAAGKTPFTRVSMWKRWEDIIYGFFHSGSLLHRYCDPIVLYRARLLSEINNYKESATAGDRLRRILESPGGHSDLDFSKLDRRDDGSKISLADQLRAQISFKGELLSQWRSQKELRDQALEELKNRVDNDSSQAEIDHKNWYTVLQRPAYYEILQISSAPLSSISRTQSGRTTDPVPVSKDDGTSRETRFGQFFSALIAKYSAPVMVPIEGLYSYAAFNLVTPHSLKFSVAASAIFTISLALTGYTAANFGLRAVKHKVVDSSQLSKPSQPGKAAIETSINLRMLTAAMVMSLVGLVLIIGGADLRSKLPEIDRWTVKEEWLESRLLISQKYRRHLDA